MSERSFRMEARLMIQHDENLRLLVKELGS
jgi:hypothetical protein